MSFKRRLVVIGAGFLSSYTALGFIQPKGHDHGPVLQTDTVAKEKVLRLAQKSAPLGLKGKQAGAQSVKLDAHTGAIRVMTGPFNQVPVIHGLNQEDYIQTAKDFIGKHFSVFGVSENDIRLVQKAILLDKDDQFIKFHVYRNGIKVADAGIDFRFKYGQLTQVINQTFSEARLSSRPVMSGAEVDEAAAAMVPEGEALRKKNEYRVEKLHKGYQLIPVTSYELKGSQLHHDLQLNQINGKVYELKDRHYHLSGQATVETYPRWYNETIMSKPFTNGYVMSGNAKITTDGSGSFALASDSQVAPKVDGLNGQYVTVALESGEKLVRNGNKAGDAWQVHINRQDTGDKWLDKQTAQSMIYVSTTEIVNQAKRFISSPWLDKPLVANANLNSTCNAHWDGSTINLYSGDSMCANTGLISDVIFHEWGHGLDDATGGIEDGAFSEGYGDIMSLIMTRSSQLGIGFLLDGFRPVRELATDKIYPRDTGEVHAEGLIIGSTFWDLFEALSVKHGENEAVELLKKYAFKMIFTARTYLDVYEAVLAIDDNDQNLANGTPNKCVINKVFNAHGLTEIDQGCLLASIDTFDMFDTDGDKTLEPGESIELSVSVRNQTPRNIPNLNGTLTVTEGQHVTIERGDFHWQDVPSQGRATSADKGLLVIGPQAACGSRFTTKLKLYTTESGEEREVSSLKSFVIGKNVGVAANYAAANMPLDIVDHQTVYADFPATNEQWDENTLVESARLKFSFEHSYLADVIISLVAPDGVAIEIYKGKGMEGEVNFDEDVTKFVTGKKGKGVWKLAVTDLVYRDEGVMNQASIDLTPAKYVCD